MAPPPVADLLVLRTMHARLQDLSLLEGFPVVGAALVLVESGLKKKLTGRERRYRDLYFSSPEYYLSGGGQTDFR